MAAGRAGGCRPTRFGFSLSRLSGRAFGAAPRHRLQSAPGCLTTKWTASLRAGEKGRGVPLSKDLGMSVEEQAPCEPIAAAEADAAAIAAAQSCIAGSWTVVNGNGF